MTSKAKALIIIMVGIFVAGIVVSSDSYSALILITPLCFLIGSGYWLYKRFDTRVGKYGAIGAIAGLLALVALALLSNSHTFSFLGKSIPFLDFTFKTCVYLKQCDSEDGVAEMFTLFISYPVLGFLLGCLIGKIRRKTLS